MKVQLVKSYCLPLLVYCIGVLRLKRSTVQHLSVCWNDGFRKIFHYKRFESVKMLQIQFGTMDFSHLYDFCRWNFWSSLLKKCYFLCHFLTMLDLKLHSCVDLAHVYGYSSDRGSFRDCVVRLVIVCNCVHCIVFLFYLLFSCCIRCE